MTAFSPIELRDRLTQAIEIWTEGLCEDFPDGIPMPDEWDMEDCTEEISEDSYLNLTLRYWEDSVEITCRDFLGLIDNFSQSKFVRAVGCIWPQHALWRITPTNQLAHRVMNSDVTPEDDEHSDQLAAYYTSYKISNELREQIEPRIGRTEPPHQDLFHQYQEASEECTNLARIAERPAKRRHVIESNEKGRKITVCLTTGFTVFGLHVANSDLSSKYSPPIDWDEAFVEIRSNFNLTEEEIINIVQSYIFEISATTGAEFTISPRLEIEEEIHDDDEPPLPSLNRLRPLATGKGIPDLLDIYNRAIGTSDDELRILCFTKVIEYVAQTVIRRQSTELIRGKLMSARAISPDAAFISELELLMEQQRVYKKDRESIRLAVCQCCDATELARISPPFLKELLKAELPTDPKLQNAALLRFADVLYSTRNSIAHAKANYTVTGEECPSEQITQLNDCAKLAAEQAIRWFDSVQETHRVF